MKKAMKWYWVLIIFGGLALATALAIILTSHSPFQYIPNPNTGG
jgi:hypothetical protein